MIIVTRDRTSFKQNTFLLVDNVLQVLQFHLHLVQSFHDTRVLICKDELWHSNFATHSVDSVNDSIVRLVFNHLKIDTFRYGASEDKHVDFSLDNFLVS